MTDLPVARTIIEPDSGLSMFDLREAWAYRGIVTILAWRDVKLRYKQTALGIIWVVLQPLLSAAILAVIFGRFAGLPAAGVPYGLFVYTGILFWNFFAGAVQRASTSLIADAKMVTKVYFPRVLVPIASALAVFVDFAVGVVVYLVLLLFYRWTPPVMLAALPLVIILTVLAAAGFSMWLSALTVKYRDFIHALPFMIQIWMFASPVVYSASVVPSRWQWLYALNPVAGIVEAARWSMLGRSAVSLPMITTSAAVSLIALVSGVFFFRRVERNIADLL